MISAAMLKFVARAEELIGYVLMLLLLVSVVLGTVELARVLGGHILELPFLLFDVQRLSESFGLFLAFSSVWSFSSR
jgi:hypothetical protein